MFVLTYNCQANLAATTEGINAARHENAVVLLQECSAAIAEMIEAVVGGIINDDDGGSFVYHSDNFSKVTAIYIPPGLDVINYGTVPIEGTGAHLARLPVFATVRHPFGIVNYISVHCTSDGGHHNAEILEILDKACRCFSDVGPIIIGGDFNQDPENIAIDEGLFTIVNSGNVTQMSGGELDYFITYGAPAVGVCDYYTGGLTNSDHILMCGRF